MKPGKYNDISLTTYHKIPAWSKTMLDHISKSPAHYQTWEDNRPDPTPSMIFGAAFHCAVLTPLLYEKEYAIYPTIDKRTKKGKEVFEQFLALNNNKSIISFTDAAKIELMKKRLYAHPLASQVLTAGEAEQSFFWTDPETKIECKARPDYLRFDDICIDMKVSHNILMHDFQNTVYKFRYHVQGAFFMDGIFHSTNQLCKEFIIIAIEDEPPFGIMVYVLDDYAIAKGAETYHDDLRKIKHWREFPELYEVVYPESVDPIELSLPAWVK